MHNSIKCYTFAESNQTSNEMNKYKTREVIKMLEDDGWVKVTQKGSHRQYKHPTKKGRVTVNGKDNEIQSQFLLNSIWKQAGWK